MDAKTNKLLQQAGKYLLLGKLTLALEQYLKIDELEPEDTTIMNTIGDLYNRIENCEQALLWYEKLARTFEYRELPSNAIAAYRKILRLSPKSQETMIRLAELYERQGQMANAKLQYKVLANQWLNLGNCEKALEYFQKICDLLPNCPDSRFELAQIQEKAERRSQACESYLKAADLMARQGNVTAAASMVESIFRLRPLDKEFVKAFFNLLRDINLTERGVQYLQSVALDSDPDFRAMLGEVFLHDGNFEVAQRFLPDVRKNPKMYPATMKMLQQLIGRGNLSACLEVVDAVFEISIQQNDELNLKKKLDSMLEMNPNDTRILKTLTTLLIRTNDTEKLETLLKQLAILQLQSGNLREAKDALNKVAVYAQNSFYLDLVSDLNDAIIDGMHDVQRETCQKVIRALERGSLDQDENQGEVGLAMGVTDLDLGLGLEIQIGDELFNESPS